MEGGFEGDGASEGNVLNEALPSTFDLRPLSPPPATSPVPPPSLRTPPSTLKPLPPPFEAPPPFNLEAPSPPFNLEAPLPLQTLKPPPPFEAPSRRGGMDPTPFDLSIYLTFLFFITFILLHFHCLSPSTSLMSWTTTTRTSAEELSHLDKMNSSTHRTLPHRHLAHKRNIL